MSEWMNYIKEKIAQGKEDASVWYGVASRWFMMGALLLYLAGCIVAGSIIGPVRYIEFLYHCCHFEQAAQAEEKTPEAPVPCAGLPHTASPDRAGVPPIKPESSF